ncbi:serine/threonine-protein kinase TOR-like [Magnolia sinica]|uniref:serine/threonine-protein kinase TOR-like n=1 Tax=Magnolia sinica TaxID=86752 RepID=UPI0026583AC7|nr:serine/threonine-protein kinase TOR-like [Magnolia sinica]
MYAIGRSANPTINSQGNKFLAPTNCFAKEALVVKLREGTGPNANTGVVTRVLATVGELARVGGFGMKQYLGELMQVIVEALLDGAAIIKWEVAVATLSQVVQSTRYCVLIASPS